MTTWALEFRDIPTTISDRADLRERMLHCLTLPISGKATEGGTRLDQLRVVLTQLINGSIDLRQSYLLVAQTIPRDESSHSADNRVFATGWEERLIRTQLSRLYNQAVLELLVASGATHCFVAHSSDEKQDSQCSIGLAGRTHLIAPLLERLISSYIEGRWSKELKIPEHPHCTHVISPVPSNL